MNTTTRYACYYYSHLHVVLERSHNAHDIRRDGVLFMSVTPSFHLAARTVPSHGRTEGCHAVARRAVPVDFVVHGGRRPAKRVADDVVNRNVPTFQQVDVAADAGRDLVLVIKKTLMKTVPTARARSDVQVVFPVPKVRQAVCSSKSNNEGRVAVPVYEKGCTKRSESE